MKRVFCLTFFLLFTLSYTQLALSSPDLYYITYSPPEDTRTDVIDFTRGFLQGIGLTSIFNEIRDCILDTETFTVNITTAIEDIRTMNPEKVKEGIQILGQTSHFIPVAIEACKGAEVDVESVIKIIETFANPASFVYRAGKSLIINSIEVFNEVLHIVISYKTKNFESMGYWAGKAMFTIFVKNKEIPHYVPLPAQNPFSDPEADIIDFARGFFQGIGLTSVFDEVKECLVDTEGFAVNLTIAIRDIRTKNPKKVKEGIMILGETTQLIPVAMKTCQAAERDVESIAKIIETFQNPGSVIFKAGKSLLVNYIEVFEEVYHIIVAYKKQDFQSVGYWVGKTMNTIFLKVKLRQFIRDPATDILDFVEGFLQGIGSAQVFQDIKACVNDSATIIGDIENGVKDIETKNPEKIRQGIALLGQAAHVVPDAVQICKASTVDVEILVKMVEAFTSPESFLVDVGKSILINHVEVFKEVMGAVKAYESGNYTELGYWVGAAMNTIFLQEEPVGLSGWRYYIETGGMRVEGMIEIKKFLY